MQSVKEYTEEIKAELKQYITDRGLKPCLVVIQVGDRPESNSYVRGKIARLKEELERVKMVERLTTKVWDAMQKAHSYVEKSHNIELNTGGDDFEEIIEKLGQYEELEEQGLLLKLKQVSVNDVVDKLFSHNEIISLWRKVKDEVSYRKRIWYGMAWDIPEELKNCKFVKIFGTIPESIAHADIINIEVVLSEEAEKVLAEMEK